MKPVNSLFAAAAITLATTGAPAVRAQGVEILNEGFGSVSGLSGWTRLNQSIPAGNGWFQGNPGIFGAQAGPAASYAAADFLGAAYGSGVVDNWLLTPVLDLGGASVLSFYTRHGFEPGFADRLEVLFSAGTGLDPAGFTRLATIGADGAYPTDWERFSVGLDAIGSGRFAFRYFGPADTLNFVGLDTVSVVTAVPEPSAWAMFGAGLGLFGLRRRNVNA